MVDSVCTLALVVNQKRGCAAADAKSANALMGTLQENMLYSRLMLSTYAVNAVQPFFYTYSVSIVVAIMVIGSLLYAVRDMIGGFVLAGIVYYLYTM